MKGKAKLKTTTSLILNIILYVFLAICVISVTVTLISKKNDDGAEIFGYQMRIVTSESMAKNNAVDVSDYDIGSIPLNSMVFVQTVPDDPEKAEKWYADVEVGDVLTFKYLYASHVTITHRVTNIVKNPESGYTFYLEGDNGTDDADVQIINTADTDSVNYVIGKVTAKSYIFGLLISLLQKPVGIVLVVIIPCFIIIMMEVFRIIGVINDDKRRKALEEAQKKNDEIEALRRRLAELEGANEPQSTADRTTVEEGKS